MLLNKGSFEHPALLKLYGALGGAQIKRKLTTVKRRKCITVAGSCFSSRLIHVTDFFHRRSLILGLHMSDLDYSLPTNSLLVF